MQHILVLNGPNLNLLGQREPEKYGCDSLEKLEAHLRKKAGTHCHLQFFQTNSEAELINAVHSASQNHVDFIIINPAAFTHTSIALRDALLAVKIPFIEVHISNIYAREPFRQHSYLSDIAIGVISGLGILGYELALNAALQKV